MEDSFFDSKKYFYEKCVYAIIFSRDVNEKINYVFNHFNVDINIFYNILEKFLKNNCFYIEKDVKDNIFIFLDYLNSISECGKKHTFLNLIIGCSDSKKNDLVFSEYNIRFMDRVIALGASSQNMCSYSYQMLRDMFVDDLRFLIAHTSACKSENFNKVSKIFADNALKYIASVNKIIYECPLLLKDDLFIHRVHSVCSMISDSDEISKVYRKFKDLIV